MYTTTSVLVLFLLFVSPATRVSTADTESRSQPVASQTVLQLAPFSSVELRNGGKVFLKHGPIQRVTLLNGSLDYSQVKIAGDQLVIDKCRNDCPRGYELRVEIVTPDIAGISITDGGTIAVRGSFPRRAEIRVAVHSGGTIDIRALTVDSVNASVSQGGRIFTRPQSAMIASVRQGGNITYWGDEVQVKSSIRQGGVVTKGSEDEADQPLSDSDDDVPAVPPVAPVP